MAAAATAADVAKLPPGLGEALPYVQRTGCCYLEYNGTTPIFPEVAQEMRPFLDSVGNPSSGHVYGRGRKAALERARRLVAEMLGAEHADEVAFTSCGTESDNWAIWGVTMAARKQHTAAAAAAAAAADGGGGGAAAAAAAAAAVTTPFVPHVVTSCIEHPAVLQQLAALADLGLLRFTAVPVGGEGVVAVADVAAALCADTVLLTFMHSNNEVGSIQPIAELAALAHAHGALLHCDAAQSVGKVPVDVRRLGADLLTVVGHKFGGPGGVAALYVRRGVRLEPLLHGGGQEGGRRAGTENVLLAAGLGAAAALVSAELGPTGRHMAALRDSMQRQLLAALPPGVARVHGPADDALRLPNTLSIGIRGISSAALLAELSEQLAASAGAACHSSHSSSSPCDGDDGGQQRVSPVLAAMGVPRAHAVGTLRLSVGRHTTQAEVDGGVQLILDYVRQQGGELVDAAGGAA